MRAPAPRGLTSRANRGARRRCQPRDRPWRPCRSRLMEQRPLLRNYAGTRLGLVSPGRRRAVNASWKWITPKDRRWLITLDALDAGCCESDILRRGKPRGGCPYRSSKKSGTMCLGLFPFGSKWVKRVGNSLTPRRYQVRCGCRGRGWSRQLTGCARSLPGHW